MGKNIKFFKKVTSLVLTGLTIFSSVPAKAWKEEDPREAIKAEVRSKLQQGYKEITFKDSEKYNAITGYSTSGFMQMCKIVGSAFARPIDGLYGVFIDTFMGGGSKVDIDDKYFETICQTKNCDKENIVSLEFVDKITQGVIPIFRQINFPNLIEAELQLNSGHDSCFCGICFLADDSIGTTFSKCPDLKLLRVTGKSKIGFLNNDYFNTERKEHIDLFPSCKHSVLVVCETQEQADSFRKIMGKKGDRHKVLLKKDFEKFDEVHKQSVKYNVNDTTIKKGNAKNKNIVIPKHVKKIGKGAFKNAGLCGVTFEEGIEEIEFCDGCFAGCPLVKFELPKSLKKIVLGKNCFAGCPNELYIENYVRGEIERIEKEKEAEKQRVRDEVKKAADYIIDRQAKEKAAYLKKIKEENEQRIKKRKEEIKEAIKVLEANKLKAVGAQGERQKDLDEKIKVDTSSMNEVEIKIFNAEKAMLEAKLEAANSNLELIDTDLQGKNEMLQELDNSFNVLKIKAEFEKIFFGLQEREVKLSKTLDEIKERIKKAEAEEKRNKEEAERLATIAKEQAEKAAEQEKTDKRQAEEQQKLNERQKKLNEEQQKIKKEKIFWNSVKFLGKAVLTLSPLAPFIPVVGPIITSVVQPIITSSVSAVTSIVGLVANLTVDICKSLFTSKSKKEVHQKPSNSASNTSATPV